MLQHRHSLSFSICKRQIIIPAIGRTILKNNASMSIRTFTVTQNKPVREMPGTIMLLFL